MPVMLVYGDSDVYRPEHIVKFCSCSAAGGGLPIGGQGSLPVRSDVRCEGTCVSSCEKSARPQGFESPDHLVRS